ncbi:MAG: hypothetical protein JSW27_21875 [Phycisphaerales bacterium]|nr:MAG: hypothetical protein JSW27_21875 [Phycisphaerales bacterium]
MGNASVVEQLGQKGVDIEAMVEQVIGQPESIAALVEAIQTEKSTAKYAYEKVLRLVSEREPELIYPWFEVFVTLLDCDNSFLKWGAIMTVANLVAADAENKFELILRKHYAPIKGPVMITAANIIGSSVRITQARPDLTQRIAREILKVERAKYEKHGAVSPECRNVAIGQVIEAFDQFFDGIEDQSTVRKFVKRQLKNTRKPVVRKAEKFLSRHVN